MDHEEIIRREPIDVMLKRVSHPMESDRVMGERYTVTLPAGVLDLEDLADWCPPALRDPHAIGLLHGDISVQVSIMLAGTLVHEVLSTVAIFVPERQGYLVCYSDDHHRFPIGYLIPVESVIERRGSRSRTP